MRYSITAGVLAAASLMSLSMTPSVAACGSCAKSVQLDQKQLACLELLLPAFLAEATDPVIVSLLRCSSQAAISASDSAHTDPVLKPKVDPNGDKDVSDKVYFLTKKQILCLSDNMEALKKKKGPQVRFAFNGCKKL